MPYTIDRVGDRLGVSAGADERFIGFPFFWGILQAVRDVSKTIQADFSGRIGGLPQRNRT